MKDKNRYIVVVILQSIIILLLTLNVYNLYKVGIKQKGIDNLILKEVTQDTYDKITLFMNESEEEYYESIYKYNKISRKNFSICEMLLYISAEVESHV